MNLDLSGLRELERGRLAELWSMKENGQREQVPPEDEGILQAMEEHREFYPLWLRLGKITGDVRVGEMDPLWHITLHAVLENQIRMSDPPEIAETLKALLQAGFTRFRAIHLLGYVLVMEIHPALEGEKAFNIKRYRGRLRIIREGLKDLSHYGQMFRDIGRNDLCPCGSGMKFKKCCSDFFPIPLDPVAWIFRLTRTSSYLNPKIAAATFDNDGGLLIENASAVADALEKMGDAEGALLAHQNIVELARTGESHGLRMRDQCLISLMGFAERHKEFSQEGLAALDELSQNSYEQGMDVEVALTLTRVGFLMGLGRRDEGEALYTELAQRPLTPHLQLMVAGARQYWDEASSGATSDF